MDGLTEPLTAPAESIDTRIRSIAELPPVWQSARERLSSGIDAYILETLGDLLHVSAAAHEATVQQARDEADHAYAAELEQARAEMARATADLSRALADFDRELAERVRQARVEMEQGRAAELARIRADAEQILAAQVNRLRSDLGRAHADEVARLKDDYTRLFSSEIVRAREQERTSALAGIGRLLLSIRRLDDAQSLSDVLEILAEALQHEAPRVAMFMVQRERPTIFRLIGLTASDVQRLALEDSDATVVARAIQTGDTCFTQAQPSASDAGSGPGRAQRGLAVPISVGGKVTAVVYADEAGEADGPDTPAWTEAVEMIVRHAGRCLEVVTATLASRLAGSWSSAADTREPHPIDPSQIQPVTSPSKAAPSFHASILTERRGSLRIPFANLPWVSSAKLLPGRDVALLDLSDGGALVESEVRLAPNTSVVLQLLGSAVDTRIPGRIGRAASESDDSGPQVGKFRGSVVFSEPLRPDWVLANASSTDDAAASAALPGEFGPYR